MCARLSKPEREILRNMSAGFSSDLEGAHMRGQLVSFGMRGGEQIEYCSVTEWPPASAEADLVMVDQHNVSPTGTTTFLRSRAIDLSEVSHIILHKDKFVPKP